jgi:hypothetical protein
MKKKITTFYKRAKKKNKNQNNEDQVENITPST